MTTLRAGAARVDITPSMPTPMAGYPVIHLFDGGPQDHVGYAGRVGLSSGCHDPLYARALALDDGRYTQVLVALDLCMVTADFTAAVRAAAAARAGIVPEGILLAASHTHSGPDLFGHWEPPTPGSAEEATERVVQAIVSAVETLRPAVAGWGAGQLPEPITNRRDLTRSIDPAVGVLRVEDRAGQVIGSVFTYACHPIIVGSANRTFSADYPGYAAAVLERAFGPEAVCLFLPGAAGNINPCAFPYAKDRNVSALARAQALAGEPVTVRSHAAARRFGNLLGGEALRATELTPVVDNVPLGIRRGEAEVPLKAPDDLERYFTHLGVQAPGRAPLAGRDTLSVELQVLGIGDGAFVCLPGEPFVEIGLAIKAAGGGRPVFPVGYANGYPGYIPAAADYFENRYESVATPLGASAPEQLERAAIALLEGASATAAGGR